METGVIISLGLSSLAIIVSLVIFWITYSRSRKTEQLKLCMEIESRLNVAGRKIEECEAINDEKNLPGARLLLLSHWNFFSLFVNNEEISDGKMLDYFKSDFKATVERIFELYPRDVRDNKDRYKQVKILLKKWDPGYYSLHFESKQSKQSK